MLRVRACGGVLLLSLFWSPIVYAQEVVSPAPPTPPTLPKADRLITLDFNNVDLPVFIKFISELTRKNFVIDERVRGKVTIFSPARITADQAYAVFLSVLELKGFAAVPSGEVIKIVPLGEIAPDRLVNVYSLENANAEEMVKILSGMIAARMVAPPGAPGRPAAHGPGEFEGPVQVLADKATNSLVITASAKDYEILKAVIAKLDVKRRQVYVEAVIMEVGLDRLREIGTDVGAVFADQTLNGDLTVLGGFNLDPTDLAGQIGILNQFNVSVSPVNVRSLLRALQTSSGTNILSTPQLLTSDNQKAEIVVGENRPFVTGQSQTVGGNVQTTIERRDVGITLRLTPQVMEKDMVRLDVFQEVSTVSESVSQAVGNVVVGPTTNRRAANTSVVVGDGKTVVIGGLIRDNVTRLERKIPLLGDIPVLGWLFKFRTKRSEKTNLLIFLTPRIVRDEEDLEEIRRRKGVEMGEFLEKNRVDQRERREELLGPLINPPPIPHGEL